MQKIKRVLISVSDKTGLLNFAKSLVDMKIEIFSTKGTNDFLKKKGVLTQSVESLTGYSSAFDGRCKTLSFEISASLLFDRKKHKKQAVQKNIKPLDMVVCNLYPFENTWSTQSKQEEMVEQIDIGGVTLLRAAAKNFAFVASVCSPRDYDMVAKELQENSACLTLQRRKYLMQKTFAYTALYDQTIAIGMTGNELVYGENPHQRAFCYSYDAAGMYNFRQKQGKRISFNNLVDMNSAFESVSFFKGSACCIIKHKNPCGFAKAEDIAKLLPLAWGGDPISAFGSIIAFNCLVTKEDLKFLELESKKNAKFVEVVIAKKFTKDALDYLSLRKKIIAVHFNPNLAQFPYEIKNLANLVIYQKKSSELYKSLAIKTKSSFEIDKELVIFGLKIVKQLSSNAVAIVKRQNKELFLVGMGCGQPNRLDAIKLACQKSLENLKNFGESKKSVETCYLISDAFFPFEDNIILANSYGITKFVSTGGSIRDQKIIAICDKLDLNMIFTGIRYFKH